MRESAIERYFVTRVSEAGGVAEKFKSPGRRNVPDRIVLWPVWCRSPGCVDFVELKRPGKDATPAQIRDHERRRALGYVVHVIASKEGVDRYVSWRREYMP